MSLARQRARQLAQRHGAGPRQMQAQSQLLRHLGRCPVSTSRKSSDAAPVSALLGIRLVTDVECRVVM